SVLQLVVVHSDRIREYNIHSIIVCPGGQPLYQPLASLQSVEFHAKGCRVGFPVLPKTRVDESRSGPGRGCAHGDVWHEDDIGTEQRGCPDILDDVVIVTDEDAAFPAAEIKHAILLAW